MTRTAGAILLGYVNITAKLYSNQTSAICNRGSLCKFFSRLSANSNHHDVHPTSITRLYFGIASRMAIDIGIHLHNDKPRLYVERPVPEDI